VHAPTTVVDDATASITPFRPIPRPGPRPGPRPAPVGVPSDHEVELARDQLSALLVDAAALDLTDGPAWDRLRADARVRIDTLVAAGVLPSQLRVEHRTPAVVVARTVATAWRWSQAA
jgi:hypothetical protein